MKTPYEIKTMPIDVTNNFDNAATHCLHGHEFTPENTHIYFPKGSMKKVLTPGDGDWGYRFTIKMARQCKTCTRIRVRRYYKGGKSL
tara:strand:+ start:281 stop:541 length:261 start_codon:yes stop_codon:yes gene_type:complete